MAICVFLPFLAEEQHLGIEEEMPLHWLEPCQVLHLVVTLLVVSPDIEGALHQQLTKLIHITLWERSKRRGGTHSQVQALVPNAV